MGNKKQHMRALAGALLASVSSHVFASTASAQNQTEPHAAAAQTTPRLYDISAQPLISALAEFARQSDLALLTPDAALQGLTAPNVRGRLTPQAALDQILAPTSLRGRIENGRILLTPRGEIRSDANAPLADEITVTGTSIRGIHPAGANLLVLDQAAIEDTGRASLSSLLETVPQNSSVSQNEMSQLASPLTAANLAFGAGINLRGLGADATLTLLNGRRLAAAGAGNFVDIAIPLSAIERVEILADGASATYGSDAVGGVVNIILRRDFSGAETRLRFGGPTQGGAEEWGAAQLWGHDWGRGAIMAAYEFRERGALARSERALSASSDLTALGGSDYSTRFANPGNISRIGATPVTLAIPAGQNGMSLGEADLLPGRVNLNNENAGIDLLPSQRTHALFVSGNYEITPRLDFFFDALATQRDAEMRDAQIPTTLIVPESNAYRLANTLFSGQGPLRIQYSFLDELGPTRYRTQTRDHAAVAGLTWRFTDAWRLEASVSHSAHVDEVAFSNALDSAALALPLASSDLTDAFNPFGDGAGANMPSVLAGLTRRQDAASDSTMTLYNARLSGSAFDLPGGPLRFALGAERRDEAFSLRRIATRASGAVEIVPTQRPGARITDAIYGEIFAPLLHTLSLSLSARHEHSSDFGDTTNPKIGLRWTPVDDITFNATWGTSFKAPLFLQLYSATNTSYANNSAAFDPYADNGATGTLTLSGGNRGLGPERAETWTAGALVTPSLAPGLSFGATYFEIDFSDRVSTPGSVINAFRSPVSFGGYFIRDPSPDQIAAALALDSDGVTSGAPPPEGVEVIFDARLINLAQQRVRGVDLEARYAIDLADAGEISASVGASGLLEFASQANPAAPRLDLLDTIFNPVDWRGRATLAYSKGGFRGQLAANYVDDYSNTLPLAPERIGAWTTLDARLAYQWDGGDGSSTPGAQIALNIQNIGNEDPPFADNPVGIGFDSLNSSPLGRIITLELTRRW